MMDVVALVILGVLLAVVLMQFFKKKREEVPADPVEDLANLKITEARSGDVISISGVGDNYTDLDFTADRMIRYEGGARRWFELSGPYRERRVALRVSDGDDVEAAVDTGARKLTLEDLGLAEEDLASMDERQNTADSFEFDGAVWLYGLSREVKAQRDGDPQPTGFYYWEFREQNGKRLLAARKAEGEPFAVTEYTGVPVGDITLYRGARS